MMHIKIQEPWKSVVVLVSIGVVVQFLGFSWISGYTDELTPMILLGKLLLLPGGMLSLVLCKSTFGGLTPCEYSVIIGSHLLIFFLIGLVIGKVRSRKIKQAES